MLKKIILSTLITMGTFAGMATNTYANTNIGVTIDGKKLAMDSEPITVDGRVMVPMRPIFESLGFQVDWDGNDRQIHAYRNNNQESFQIHLVLSGGNMVCMYTEHTENGDLHTNFELFPEPFAQVIDGRTMVPTRAIAEAIGCDVNWDSDTKTVKIVAANAKINPPVESIFYSNAEPVNLFEQFTSTTANTDHEKTEAVQQSPEVVNKKEVTYLLQPPEVGTVLADIVIGHANLDPNALRDASSYKEAYRLGSIGQCTWYAEGRLYEIYGIRLPFGIGNAGKWIDNVLTLAPNEFEVIYDLKNIQPYSIGVYKDTSKDNHPGHVLFIEYVEYDSKGNPVNIYFTEGNMNQEGTYIYGLDGSVQVLEYSKFIQRGSQTLLGYIVPK